MDFEAICSGQRSRNVDVSVFKRSRTEANVNCSVYHMDPVWGDLEVANMLVDDVLDPWLEEQLRNEEVQGRSYTVERRCPKAGKLGFNLSKG